MNTPAPVAAGGEPGLFLQRLRRRLILRGTLFAALFAAILNESVRWGAIGVSTWLQRALPVLDVGPLFLLAAVPILQRRWNLETAALRADRALLLNDRLTSFVAFGRQVGIAAEIRVAQAGETARALAGTTVGMVAPLQPWLAAGPLLLAASLLYPLFLPIPAETTAVQLARILVPGRFEPGDTPLQERTAFNATGAGGNLPTRRTPPAAAEKSHAKPGEAGPRDGEKTRSQETAPSQPGPSSGSGGQAGADRPPRAIPEGDRGGAKEPERIASERVGSGLARVVDPLFTPGPGAAPPAPPPVGTFSFHLLPKSARGRGDGQGDRPNESAVPERVTVDFDAVPEHYRAVVRAYFELLSRDAEQRAARPPSTHEGGPVSE